MNMKEKLLKAYKNGCLLEELDKTYRNNRDERELLNESLISLYNSNKVDILAEFLQAKSDFEGINFFSIKQVFQEVLPELNAEVAEVVKCIMHFVSESGSDGLIFSAFTKYCEVDSDRSKAILAMNFDDDSLEFMYSAITAGGSNDSVKFLGIAIELLNDGTNQRRKIVILAIGAIDYKKDQIQINKAFESLLVITQQEFDDLTFSAVLRSAFKLYFQNKNLDKEFTDLAATIVAFNTDEVSNTASNLFGFESKKLPEPLLEMLLDNLKSADVDNKNVLANIGYGLVELFKANKQEIAYELLETLLCKHEGKLKINDFSYGLDELCRKKDMLNQVVTRWLMSKKIALCEAASYLISQAHENDIELIFDKAHLETHAKLNLVFISYKAIGWFSMKPVSSASFIVSLLNDVDESDSEKILSAVLEFLLINYSGKVKKYFERVINDQTAKVQGMLEQLLSDLKGYSTGLDEVWEIQELSPPQAHRESYSRYHNRIMTKAYKEAEKNSFMSQIFTKTILLYGNKSIHYMHDLDDSGQATRVESPMHGFETTIEVARFNNIDPHGYDYWMRVFRVEGCS